MCGIAGFCNRQKTWREDMERMKEQLISRGPDAEGSWCNDSQDVTLGHRRLSILDLSPGGAQPMVSHSGRFVISYNGEIYNCREVEKKLRREGLLGALHGSSDTEILLEALEAYGVKEGICLCKGMFAIALYDRKEEQLWLLRDRVGEKPLYYGLVNGSFVFASELTAIAALPDFCGKINKDVLDLYLIHWPVPGCYLSTWKVLEEIQKSGRALSIGVSNFEIRHLEELEANSGIIPAVNQIECHPLCYPKELIDYCQDKGIQVQAYAPLARGAYLDNDVMCVLGTKYAHTPAQIGLRWATQKGISVIPKSVHPDRIRSNGNIFDFTIEQEDMDLIDTLNENFHSSHVPEDLRDIAF